MYEFCSAMEIRKLFLCLMMASTLNTLQAQEIISTKADSLMQLVQQSKGVVVVNFWSTWCKPCIDEIPHFIEVYEEMKGKGVELWLVSQDTRDLFNNGKLRTYIAGKEGWGKAKLFWFNETDADYYCPMVDEKWSGVIPATLIVNNGKGYRKFIEDSLTAEQLMAEIEKAM
jgi:thiol-disulfide isomerase/thioredoxin